MEDKAGVDKEVVRRCAIIKDEFTVKIAKLHKRYVGRNSLTQEEVDQLVLESCDLLQKLHDNLAVYGISCDGLFCRY